MIDEAKLEELRRHWDEGWNGEDLDTIMAPFAADVVFSSPYVSRFTGDPETTTIEGATALREYLAQALARTPGIRYSLQDVYAGTDAVVLVYSCVTPDGTHRLGADSMRVDGDGKVVEWRCHYTLGSMR
jgi:ketosteroid isomerase-like protein